MPFDPKAEDCSDYATGTLDCSFEELLGALRADGAEVERFLITDDGHATPIAND